MRSLRTAVSAGAGVALIGALLMTAAGCAAPRKALPAFTVKGHQGVVYIVAVSQADSGDDSLWAIARSLSERKADPARNGTVQVMFWNDSASAPTALPMTDQQVASEVAQININPRTGLSELVRNPGNKSK